MPRPGAAARGGGADDRRGASCPGTRASQRSSVPPPGGLERRSGVGPAAQKSLGRPSFPLEGKSPNDVSTESRLSKSPRLSAENQSQGAAHRAIANRKSNP